MLTQLTPQSTLTEVNLGSYLLGAASITEILPAHGFLPIGFWHPTPWFVSVDFGLCMARFLHVLAWPCLYWIRVTHLWPEPDGVFAVCVGLYPHELLAVLAILCTLRVYSTHLWSKPRWSCIVGLGFCQCRVITLVTCLRLLGRIPVPIQYVFPWFLAAYSRFHLLRFGCAVAWTCISWPYAAYVWSNMDRIVTPNTGRRFLRQFSIFTWPHVFGFQLAALWSHLLGFFTVDFGPCPDGLEPFCQRLFTIRTTSIGLWHVLIRCLSVDLGLYVSWELLAPKEFCMSRLAAVPFRHGTS